MNHVALRLVAEGCSLVDALGVSLGLRVRDELRRAGLIEYGHRWPYTVLTAAGKVALYGQLVPAEQLDCGDGPPVGT